MVFRITASPRRSRHASCLYIRSVEDGGGGRGDVSRGPRGRTTAPAVEWRIGRLIPVTSRAKAASLETRGSTPQPPCLSGIGGYGLPASLALRRSSDLPASGGPDRQGVFHPEEEGHD